MADLKRWAKEQMTPAHIRILEEVAARGVASLWEPSHADWPIVVELIESKCITADIYRQPGSMFTLPQKIHCARLSLEGRSRLEKWREDQWNRSWKGRLWHIVTKFTLWFGALLGVAIYKVMEVLIERMLNTPPPA